MIVRVELSTISGEDVCCRMMLGTLVSVSVLCGPSC